MDKRNFHMRLNGVIQKSHRMVMKYFHSMSATERAAYGTWESWVPKDQLSHITYWERRAVELLSYVSRGQNPPEYPNYEECNRQNFEESKAKSIQMIMREYGTVQESVILVLKRFTEQDLREPGKHPHDRETTLLAYTLGYFYIHPLTHIVDGYLKLGDSRSADRTADQMVSDILSVDDSPRLHGTVLYNRACFYALTGSLAQALEHLQQSMIYRPDLKQWAQEDHDFAALREKPEFIALIVEKPNENL